MASNINANNIDGTYPVAGVDNDSQGFRTNFTNIKNNFSYAKSEIEDLQSKVIVKTALNGTTINNNFNGAVLSGAETKNFYESTVGLGSIGGTAVLDYSAASYYTLSTSDNVDLAFSSLPPAGKLGHLKLTVYISNTAHAIRLPAAVTRGLDGLRGFDPVTRYISFASVGYYYYEFLMDAGGSGDIFINDLITPKQDTGNNTIWSSNVASFGLYQYANVQNNFTASVKNRLILDSVSTLALGNVYLPAVASDGQTVAICSNNAVTTLHIISNTNTIIGNISTLAANSTVQYQYVNATNKWFRIG